MTKKRLGLALSVAAAAATAAAITIPSAFGGAKGAPRLSPSHGAIPQIGSTPTGVLQAFEARLRDVSNAYVKTELLPDENGVPTTPGLVLHYDLAVKTTVGSDLTEPLWEGQIFSGAVADEYTSQGLGQIIQADATLVTPDGQRQDAGGGIGAMARDQLFDTLPANLAQTVGNNAQSLGLQNPHTSELQGIQGVVRVDATTTSPAAAVAKLTSIDALASLLGRPETNFEGALLVVDDASGNPVLIRGVSSRTGSGITWVSPAYQASSQGSSPLQPTPPG